MPDRFRVAVGGFQHETNTFAPEKAAFEDFERPGAWPGLTRGAGLAEVVAGINIPIAGFLAKAGELGFDPLPLLWTQATPSAQVTEEAYERIVGMLLEDLAAAREAGGLDAVYLDLHGAMVAEHLEDGEGALLRRLRDLIGPEVPVVASLDLHANVTPEMVALSDALVSYRTYPHVDMAATGARVARHLHGLLTGVPARHKAFRQLPFLMQLTAGCTLEEPAKGLYQRLGELEGGAVASLSFNCGFGPADIWHCGPSVLAYGTEAEAVERAADELERYALEREGDFVARISEPAEAVRHAMAVAARAGRPVILADTQDNPGGGAQGDTTGLLRAMIEEDAEDAVLGLLYDPEAAAAAHAAGEGAELRLALGGRSGWPGDGPLEATFTVERLGDGRFEGTGPFYKGARMQLGLMALLRVGGVRVAVASRKLQAADQAIFRHLGIEPAEQRIVGLKSSVHFRADFQPIAAEVLVVAAPGPNPIDHRQVTYHRLRPGLRIMPLGEPFAAE